MMIKPFIRHTGIAARLMADNIDTDQIIPSREMKTVSKSGLAAGLFAQQRYLTGREPNPDFVLNSDLYRGSTILLSGQNFGCGSSREHAVWALKDYGFRAIIAQSFGEIFYNNCVRNGIAPITMSAGDIAALGDEVAIDLGDMTVNGIGISLPDGDLRFLREGLDPIAETLQNDGAITAFYAKDKSLRPWLY